MELESNYDEHSSKIDELVNFIQQKDELIKKL
jgi:hypothetical protein